MTRRLAGAILASGRGSNLAALLASARDEAAYPVRFVLAVSDNPAAPALGVAARFGLATVALPVAADGGRETFESALHRQLKDRGIELLCLAGFLRILSPTFVGRWPGRILNIHPSLLPRHRGLGAHARVLAAGEQESGCTVHLVEAALDAGPILGQRRVPVLPGDTPESLAERVLAAEHELYPRAVAAHARTRLAAGERRPNRRSARER